jgi:hypothetical protein
MAQAEAVIRPLMPRINSGEFDPRELAVDVDECTDAMAASSLQDMLPQDEFYDRHSSDENEDENVNSTVEEAKSKRSWLGKVGKGLYRRTIGGGKNGSSNTPQKVGDGRNDLDIRAMVIKLACL